MNLRIGGATCRFISEFPAFFEGDLKKLERKYPNVRADLDNLLEEIEKDYRRVAQARRLQGFGDLELWKYRCGSSDQVRGRQGGFRLIALVEDGIATPLVMLAKAKSEDVPPKLIRTRINNL